MHYGKNTQLSLENFCIGNERVPQELIYALVLVKKAAALAGDLDAPIRDAIVAACDEILLGKWDDEFPLRIWQSGSGTQTHMNVNEVIASLATENLGAPVHPNDHVNASQSTNDVFPTAMHIAAYTAVEKSLLTALQEMLDHLEEKTAAYADMPALARTHMGDALPFTLGERFSGYAAALRERIEAIEGVLPSLAKVTLGGTAVGNGVNATPAFADKAITILADLTALPLRRTENHFAAQAAHDTLATLSALLTPLALFFMKLVSDLRFLSSGPRCGIGEIALPNNEPGSSIMPGKTNPTQCEMLIMVAARILGNHTTITSASELCLLEAHSFRPVVIDALLQSLRLAADGARSFTEKCLAGLAPNEELLRINADKTLMNATRLNPILGYEKTTQVVQKALHDNSTLKEAVVALGFLTGDEYDQLK